MIDPTPRHILAADDSPTVLHLLQELLAAEGYRVTSSKSPLNLSTVKRIQPDLLIMDHMIDDGEGSGWHLLQELRGDPDTAAIPIVVCTGAVHRVRRQTAMLERLNVDVVLKPFDIDHLVATVNRRCGGASLDAARAGVHAIATR